MEILDSILSADPGSGSFRSLPSVDRLVRAARGWEDRLTHAVRVRLAQELLAELRELARAGRAVPSASDVTRECVARFDRFVTLGMRPVINATGVLLHTNLGRAPWGSEWLCDLSGALVGYCSLELDLEKGERGSRSAASERMLRVLTGAPGALAVNNGAAAVYLALHRLAAGQEVVISRGELVQIGGGFRIPDILAASGARLVEVGTTNITTLPDYERAITPQTGLILRVHQSCFTMEGHTESVEAKSLAALATRIGKPFLVDLGSGALDDEGIGEPSVKEALGWGADLICFSGDKLFGGPQAGIILGRDDLVNSLRQSPLYRALRLGKAELFLLEKALREAVAGKAPLLLRLLHTPVEAIRERAERLLESWPAALGVVQIATGTSTVGGGTSPRAEVQTVLVEFSPAAPERIAQRLLKGCPAVVVRRENKKLSLDLRTVLPDEDKILLQRLREVAACSS